jgi:hypothetical protein
VSCPSTRHYNSVKYQSDIFLYKLHQQATAPYLGVIHVTKGRHQTTLVQKAVAATERKAELKVSVLHTLHMITSSWNSVFSVTITSCFRKVGFVNTSEQPAEGLDEKEVEEDKLKVTSNPEIQFKDF